MFMATTSEEIKIQIGDEVKVLVADEAVAFEVMRDELKASADRIKAEIQSKIDARKAVLTKLGLSEEEVNLVLNLDEPTGGN
jgi:hypothetical protein